MNSFLHTASGYAQLFWPEKNALIWQDTNPVRAELFSVERLEQHAISLATEQRVLNKNKVPQAGVTGKALCIPGWTAMQQCCWPPTEPALQNLPLVIL